MADNAFINSTPWVPNDLWAEIASFLDNEDLAKFRQICKATQWVGSQAVLLQPHYNRLYLLDKTLPPLLPQEGALLAFQQAFEKIQTRQRLEITFLSKKHRALMARPEYVQALQENSKVSLKWLEGRSATLDEINSEIIKARIDFNINSFQLSLSYAGITRLPVTVFHLPNYVNFWKNLTHLECHYNKLTTLNVEELTALQSLICSKNQLTMLNVQGLMALQYLYCWENQMTSLDVQGLIALQVLDCSNNHLTALDVQGLAALQKLHCFRNQLGELNVQGLIALGTLELNYNPLMDLNLTGVHVATKNKYAELEISLLYKQLSQSDSAQEKQVIMARIGANYTYKNCFYYCPVYAAKLFASESANSLYDIASTTLTRAAAFLPSFGENHLKRKRDEDEVDREELSEDSENLPPAKKRKRK